MSGLGRKVSMNNVTLAVMDEIGDAWGGEQPVWEKWTKDALKLIGGKRFFKYKFYTADIENKCFAELHCDTVRVLNVALGDKTDECNRYMQENNYQMSFPKYVPGDNDFGNGFLFIDHGGIKECKTSFRWETRDGKIYFQPEVNETKITIWAEVMERDKDERLLIPEEAVQACAMYICKILSRRTLWGKKETRATWQMIEMYERLWSTTMGDARAKNSRLTTQRHEEMLDMFIFD